MMADITYREICREIVLGFHFWCVFGSLAPMIWFFPLNAMEVSGYEAYLLVLFSPIVVGPAWIRRLVQTRTGLGLIRVLSAVSLASFQASSTIRRLSILAFGNFFMMISFTASFWSTSSRQRFQTLWGLLLGLCALLVSRIWYITFVPTWTDVTSNNVVIAIVTIATIDKIIAGDDNACNEEKHPDRVESVSSAGPWIRAGLGFGGLLNLTLWLCSEVSVILRWGFKSLPDSGPNPYPWGFLVLCAVLLGVRLSVDVHNYNRFVWLGLGVAGFLSLNYLDRWFAFAGGLVLVVFVISLWPTMVQLTTSCPPGRTMAMGMLTWIYLILHEVWTVAYNFVPAGVYTREHTDHVMVIVMTAIGLGYMAGRSSENKFSDNKAHNKRLIKVLLLVLFIGAGGYIHRLPKQEKSHPPKVFPKDDFTAGVWAFHFGYDNNGWPSVVPSSQFIENSGVDFLGLLETDASKPFLGNHDLIMWLSERLGMYTDFGPSTREHCWGVAFLSKYPIVKSRHHLLPSPYGELAPAIHATVNMTNNLIDMVVTHMGNEWDSIDRQLQAEVLADILKEAENPVIFLGYVTSKPGSRDYKTLAGSGNVKDIDDTDRKRFCEYIFYRGLIRRGYARISHGGLSDTEMQIARFRVPRNSENYRDNDKIELDANKIDKHVKFNPLFGGYSEGHNWGGGHRYHMNTPKYFIS